MTIISVITAETLSAAMGDCFQCINLELVVRNAINMTIVGIISAVSGHITVMKLEFRLHRLGRREL